MIVNNKVLIKPGIKIQRHLTDSLGHKYYYYNGIPDSEKTIIGNGCNLTIPVRHFENEILKQI